MIENVQAGNTVRLTCKFYDPNGFLTSPTSVRLIIYDYRYQKLEEFTLNETNQLTAGTYYFDYATNTNEQKYIFEWYGLISGFPSIKRDSFTTFFM